MTSRLFTILLSNFSLSLYLSLFRRKINNPRRFLHSSMRSVVAIRRSFRESPSLFIQPHNDRAIAKTLFSNKQRRFEVDREFRPFLALHPTWPNIFFPPFSSEARKIRCVPVHVGQLSRISSIRFCLDDRCVDVFARRVIRVLSKRIKYRSSTLLSRLTIGVDSLETVKEMNIKSGKSEQEFL